MRGKDNVDIQDACEIRQMLRMRSARSEYVAPQLYVLGQIAEATKAGLGVAPGDPSASTG